MELAGCCEKSTERVLKQNRKPGALWHIYRAEDSDKIRDLLKKVCLIAGFESRLTDWNDNLISCANSSIYCTTFILTQIVDVLVAIDQTPTLHGMENE